MGMLKVGTTPPGPSENRMVMNEKTAPRMRPTDSDRAVICVVHGGSAAITSSSVRSWSCDASGTRFGWRARLANLRSGLELGRRWVTGGQN